MVLVPCFAIQEVYDISNKIVMETFSHSGMGISVFCVKWVYNCHSSGTLLF